MTWKVIVAAQERLAQERNTIHKDWGGKLPIALIYPNSYAVGMSSLAVHTLYRQFNAAEDVVCERVFADLDEPISLESQRPLCDFGILAFTISFELDYFNVIDILRRANIPLRARDRVEGDPLIIVGGPAVTANPAPLAPIYDFCARGDGEELIPRLLAASRACIGKPREDWLAAWERCLTSTLSPRGEKEYLTPNPSPRGEREYLTSNPSPRGEKEYLTPNPSPLRGEGNVGAQRAVPVLTHHNTVADLDAHPTASVIVTPAAEFGNMYLIEVARGCRRGCRFCLARCIYAPYRERSLDTILAQARDGLQYTDTIGLISAAISDYSCIDELAIKLREMGTRISVSSLRADSLTAPLLRALVESGAQTLTIAPEAGSARLRNRIGKGLQEAEIMRAAELAGEFDFPNMKLYYMIGLPTETDADAQEIVTLTRRIQRSFERRVTINLSPFVPKLHTPFADEPPTPRNVIKRRVKLITKELRRAGVAVKAENAALAEVQTILSRGGSELAEVLIGMREPTLREWRRNVKREV